MKAECPEDVFSEVNHGGSHRHARCDPVPVTISPTIPREVTISAQRR